MSALQSLWVRLKKKKTRRSLWVRLYSDVRATDPVEIMPIPRNIGALKAAVLPELSPSLLGEVKVYLPDTNAPFDEETPIRVDKKPKELIEELGKKKPPVHINCDHPLVVVAPAPQCSFIEQGRKQGIEETKALQKAIQKKLDAGSFFTPIDKVWRTDKVTPHEFDGCFNKLRRKPGYIETVEDYDAIVKNAKQGKRAAVDVDLVAEVQAEGDRGKGKKNSKKKSKPGKRQPKNSSSGSRKSWNSRGSMESVDEHSESDFSGSTRSASLNIAGGEAPQGSLAAGGEAPQGSLAPQGSQASDHSAFANPDFNGNRPSSRAHLDPESACRCPFAISCQAVCGVDLEEDEIILKRFADGMAKSDTNFLRAHGKMFDASPCWIFVPIVTKEFLMEWQKDQGYEILAIAGAFGETSNEMAYATLCTKHYHDDDDDAGAYLKRSRCGVHDLRCAKERLAETVMALADSLVNEGASGTSPLDYLTGNGSKAKGSKAEGSKGLIKMLQDTVDAINADGVLVPELVPELDEGKLGDVEVFKFYLDNGKTDYVPDPLLLLIKAAINWSWRCGQKLLPACGPVLEEEEGQEVSVTTPIPDIITCGAVPVTPDSVQTWTDEDWSGDDWTL